MKELIRTNDLILISRIQSILNESSIPYKLLDTHSSIIEGSISAIQKRIVVSNDDFRCSRKLIQTITNDKQEQ